MRKILVLALLLSLVSSCSWLKSSAGAAETVAIDCAKQDVAKVVGDGGLTLLAKTVDVLQAATSDWRSELATLGKAAGDYALACAVEAARAGLENARHFAASEAAARARGYEVERGWRFKSE